MNPPDVRPASTPFWVWSNWKHIGTQAEGGRTVVDPLDLTRATVARLCFGHGPLASEHVTKLEATVECADKPDDCPWVTHPLFIVSDRVRSIIEVVAPQNCQFLPIVLHRAGQRISAVYWLIYADSINCADPVTSGWSGDGRLIVDPVIVDAHVPLDRKVFRVWEPWSGHSGSIIYIRDDVRRALQREKVTGCVFAKPWTPSASAVERGPFAKRPSESTTSPPSTLSEE